MLFYVVLFLACIGIAAIAVWCYRAISGAVERVHSAIHPIWEEAYDKHLIKGVVQPTGSRAAASRGQAKSTVVAQLRQARESLPQTLSYSKPSITEAQNLPREFSIREPEFESVGNTYRVKRQTRPSRSGTNKPSKPWGW